MQFTIGLPVVELSVVVSRAAVMRPAWHCQAWHCIAGKAALAAADPVALSGICVPWRL
jgi:hypothetical protein